MSIFRRKQATTAPISETVKTEKKSLWKKVLSAVGAFFKGILKFIKKHIKLFIILLVVVIVFLYLRHKATKMAEELEAQLNEPVTSTVSSMDLQQSVSVTGTLNATETATVTSTLGGTLTGVKVSKVNYEVGDYVEAGNIVVEFDGDDYSRKVSELDAEYNISNQESANAISELEQNVKTIQQKIDDKQKYLDDNKAVYENLKDAYEQYEQYKDIDKSVVERWNRESAAAAMMAEPVSIELYEAAEDELETLQLQLENYQNQIEIAKLKQQYATTYTQVDAYDDVYESMDSTHVSAPISGYILTMNVEEGNNYSTGSAVFTLADTSGFIVEATVNEYDIAKIQEGQPAVVKFESTGDEEFTGTVSFVSLASEDTISTTNASTTASLTGTTSSSTATYKIKIKMDGTDDRMRVGMTAKASVVLDSAENVLAVPYDCVQQNEDGTFFVTKIEEDGTKTEVPVTKGLESDYYVEIAGDGIEDGMTVEAIVDDASSTDIMDYMYIE